MSNTQAKISFKNKASNFQYSLKPMSELFPNQEMSSGNAGNLLMEVITSNSGFDQNYYFGNSHMKKLLSWVYGISARNNILLIGNAGVGKSSSIIELCARLGVPVYQLACSGKTRFQHLVGTYEMRDGSTVWVDGPLTRAMRDGGVLLLDEITRMDPGEQMNLASVLDERSTLTIPDTGEVIKPHEHFRVAATGNSGGYGDESGSYVGEKPSSFAFIDRFQKLLVEPMPEEVEMRLIKSYVPNLPETLLGSMMEMTKFARENFVGNASKRGSLPITVSTRGLKIWAMESVNYLQFRIPNPVWESFKDTILNGSPVETVTVVKEVFDQWITEKTEK